VAEYCLRVAKYHLVTEVKDETKAFMRGFYSVIPRCIISIFDEDELDFLLEGT
jgi:E3 ubiquitin-protein ligase HUWE1